MRSGFRSIDDNADDYDGGELTATGRVSDEE
jgi:hypothetical protein